MRIEVLNVSKTTEKTAKGSYSKLDVAYKDLDKGQTLGKKVMSFGDWANAFTALEYAKQGDIFNVVNEKKGEYWVWTSVTKGEAGDAPTAASAGAKGTPVPRNTYETPEERARRQVLIVRQSSLSAAVDSLKTDKAVADGEAVTKLAAYYVDFVFEQGQFSKPQVGIVKSSLTDFDDDIPL